jgi:hypothetical protein
LTRRFLITYSYYHVDSPSSCADVNLLPVYI